MHDERSAWEEHHSLVSQNNNPVELLRTIYRGGPDKGAVIV